MSDAPVGDDDVFAFPASYAQQRLWFLDQIDPQRSIYNVPLALWLDGPLDPAVVSACLREIAARHESLRTTFAAQEGAPVQLVSPHATPGISIVELRDQPEGEREAQAVRLAEAEARRPFDLATGPLLRALIVVLGPERHCLVLNAHHIVCDGWSMALLLRELGALYPALAAGRASPLPPIETQYPDYSLWQRERFEGDELARELAFWLPRLQGTLPVLELPSDRPRPAAQSFEGASHAFRLPKALTAGLNQLARQEGVSLFMLTLAAFNVLLARLSGQSEIILGTPIANRDRAEIEGSIGFYTNTVLFRTDLAPSAEKAGLTFAELLARVWANVLEVFAHQDVPLEKIVEAVHPQRATSHNPIFQAMFGLQKAPDEALRLPGVRVTPLLVDSGGSKFDLTLDLQETGEELQGLLEYSTDLFDAETAAAFGKRFRLLLEGIVANPRAELQALPLLDDDDRKTVLRDWNATERDYPSERCLHELVSARAQATPEAVACACEGVTLSYGELDRRSTQLARHLRAQGVGTDKLVAVAFRRSVEMVVGLLGVLKAGAAYLPLDAAYPKERLAYMLQDAGVSLLLTQEELRDELPLDGERTAIVSLDGDAEEIARLSSEPFDGGARPDTRAYVIYTSGSTGKPKGVEIPHRAVVNFLSSMADTPGFRAGDRLLAVTTLSFDIAGLELFLPLTTGGTVVMAPEEVVTDGAALLERLATQDITLLQATPATFRMLIEAGWAGGEGGRPLKVLCGGEAMPPALAGQLLERAAEVWNMYGPTETTIWSTCERVEDPDAISIGRPIANTTIYILDERLAPVPVGVVGDLYIGGAGLARGYLNRAELTAERFVENPFQAGTRLYKTGDKARYHRDGRILFLGRGDTQVKVRGFRIELGEIETALAAHEAVAEVAVAVRTDGGGDARIVAYLVYRSSDTPTSSELRRFLRETLPDHMIPHLFVELERLPLTNNGKVDRRALPAPFVGERTDDAPTAEPPQTPMQVAIAEIWREVLKVEEVGLGDNFFDLGGHSLLSIQVIHRIASRTGHRINPRSMVFLNLEQLAAECARAEAS